jgi:hypothetical protein
MAQFNSMMLPLLVVASERTGASARQALPVALIAMMARSPMFAVITAIALTRANQRSSSSSATATLAPTSGSGAPGVSPLVASFGMPSFHGMTRDQVHDFADKLGIGIGGEVDERGDPIGNQDVDDKIRVRRQDPDIGEPPNNSNTVFLTYHRSGFR